MKLFVVVFAATCLAPLSALRAAKSPVARVVKLLQNMEAKLQADLKAEQDLFEKYQCWHKSVVESKTASNVAAQSRVDELTAYIADIDAGKIEFTTERADLTKQIGELEQDLSTAKDMREQERSDFQAAKEEMEQAIAALDESITVLEDATASPAALAQIRGAGRYNVRVGLRKALQFTRGMLGAEDAKTFEALLGGDVPKPDWRKLNRDAEFKKKYTAKSGKIISTLKGLNNTFTKNLEEAEEKEAEDEASYQKLKASKEGMLKDAQTALTSMTKENGARGLSKTEAQDEVDALGAQITADEGFIQSVKDSFVDKKAEWDARLALRNKELTGISEAIAVLHSDDARDTFTKSYASQGVSFVQESHVSNHETTESQRMACALHTFRTLAAFSQDVRLALLAKSASDSSIALVITKIDEIVAALKEEEDLDFKNKESCETQLAEKSQQARMTSLDMDSLTEDIERAQEKITTIKVSIEEQEQLKLEHNATLVQMTRQRNDEARQFAIDKQEDEDAVVLINKAKDILTAMQAEVSEGITSFVQLGHSRRHSRANHQHFRVHRRHFRVHRPHASGLATIGRRLRHASHRAGHAAHGVAHARARHATGRQPYEIVAGEAPPPPPSTWEDPTYAGAEGETQGIAAILSLLAGDVEKDIKASEDAENKAIADFKTQKGDLEAAIKDADTAISSFNDDKATAEQEVTDKTSERGAKHDQLQATLQELKDMRPGCDFILINVDERRRKRQEEVDGLLRAKAILQGAKFPSGGGGGEGAVLLQRC